MPSPTVCRDHAAKCDQVAASLPPGNQRDMFLDMARQWIAHAEKVESWEAMNEKKPDDDRYRFGSRIDAQQSRAAEREESAAT
jgi:hypothetical protein